MYQTILFDLDGTITDSSIGITKSAQFALKELGIDEPDLEKLKCFIGPPLTESFMKFYHLSPEDATSAMLKYRERYKPIGVYENSIYDGIPALLKTLKEAGRTIALATSKPETFAVEILKMWRIDTFFDTITGAELDGSRTSKTEVIEEVFRRLDYSSDEIKKTVMIGDREHDIFGAKNCGIDSIGVRYGFATEGEFEAAGATHIVDSVSALGEFLLGS